MTLTNKLFASTAAGFALAFAVAAGPVAAQPAPTPEAYQTVLEGLDINVDTLGMGDFTTANVAADDPFGDLEVDLTVVGDDNIGTWLATQSVEQLSELVQRCAVIMANAATYPTEASAFCDSAINIIEGTTDAATPPADATAPATPAPTPTPTP